jgi:hypothetical protein
MKHYRKGPWVWTILIMSLLSAFVLVHSPAKVHQASIPDRASARLGSRDLRQTGQPQIVETYGKLPLSFEANQGQTDRQVKFFSRGRSYALFLTSNEAVLSLRKGKVNSKGQMTKTESRASSSADSFFKSATFPAFFRPPAAKFEESSDALLTATDNEPQATSSVLRMKLIGANALAKTVGLDELPGKSNYFIGNDPNKWRTNVSNYSKVEYQNVYPGVDLVYYGNQRQLEYDFIVAPGSDPSRIRLKFRGAGTLRIDDEGDLLLGAEGEELRLQKPRVYQEADGTRKAVEGRFWMAGANTISFRVPDYDRSKPLVIDPVLVYSTYLGGSDDDNARGIAVDSLGNAYVTGGTVSTNFPTMNPLQPANAGYYDAFVAKLNLTGSALVYSTYLGGSSLDYGHGIAVDSLGNAYVTGLTESADFPTANALQPRIGGGTNAFVAKLNPTGSALVYSTYLGGSEDDEGFAIAVGSSGNAHVTGITASIDFPTVNPLQPTYGGGGYDAFVAEFNSAGSALVYSTYLGGSDLDYGFGIAVDSSGNAYVTGSTYSTNFPTANPLQPTIHGISDGFVAKLNATGSALVYSTYLGGSSFETGSGIAVDSSGDAYVTGWTDSADFPTTNPLQPTYGGDEDVFVVKLNAAGSALVYSTYLGGSLQDDGEGIAVDSLGNAYVTGLTRSANFPTMNPLQVANGSNYEAFVAELNPAGAALVYSTYLGGQDFIPGGGDSQIGFGIAVDSLGNAYVTGATSTTDFPMMNPLQPTYGGGSYDAFVTKINGAVDNIPPTTVATASPGPNINGWNNTNVTVTLNATDNPGGSGVKQIQFALSGAQNLGWQTVAGNTASVTISAEGTTILSYFATDNAGNQETVKTLTVRIDKTPPVISGLPAPGCTIWPPNHKLVQVATVTAMDALSGVAPGSFTVTGTSNDPANGQIVITGGPSQFLVQLGADKDEVYTLTATASDLAGNTITQQATCTVPHNQ